MESINKFLETILKHADLSKIGYAFLIFAIGYYLCLLCKKLCRKGLKKFNLTETAVNLISSSLFILLLITLIIYSLEFIGVKITSTISMFASFLSVLVLGLSFSLKELLLNIGSGILIMVYKPFQEGDYIVGAGVEGRVKEIKLFGTILKTIDNKIITIPHSKLTNDNVVNYTHEDVRRVDLVFNVSYDNDIKLIKKVIKEELLDTNEKIIDRDKYIIGVVEITNTEVKICTRFWVHTEDYWNVYYETLENAVSIFNKYKINRPYKSMVVVNDSKYENLY